MALFSLARRSIPASENVSRGPRLLDDYVLQHHPLLVHLLQHLQSPLADDWRHGVRLSCNRLLFEPFFRFRFE